MRRREVFHKMDKEIYTLIEKFAKGQISAEEMKILEEKARQARLFQEIVNDREEWLAAMMALAEARRKSQEKSDTSDRSVKPSEL